MSVGVKDNVDFGLSVVEDRASMVLGSGEGTPFGVGESCEHIEFSLDLFGSRHNYRIFISGKEARLSDIVPVARQLSTNLVLLMLETLGRENEGVPCRKGCSACCSYLIPLSIPEVFRFREEVLAMPQEKGREVLARCLEVSSRIIGAVPGDASGAVESLAEGSVEAREVVEWYGGLDVACPLLSEDLCTHYNERPTVCREHIITGDSPACRDIPSDNSSNEGPHIPVMPVSVLQALGELAADLEGRDLEAVMLPLALPWAEDNLERGRRSWPARLIVERFVAILQGLASSSAF